MGLLCSYQECMWELWVHPKIAVWGKMQRTPDAYALSGMEGIADRPACYQYLLRPAYGLDIPPWLFVNVVMQKSTVRDATPGPWCTLDAHVGPGGAPTSCLNQSLRFLRKDNTRKTWAFLREQPHINSVASMSARTGFERTESWEGY